MVVTGAKEREAFSAKIDAAIMARARNTVRALDGVTLTSLFEEAIAARCEQLEREHNRGRRFSGRGEKFPGGKPRAPRAAGGKKRRRRG